METKTYDFKPIFDELDKFKSDESICVNMLNEDEFESQRVIIEFSEICEMISEANTQFSVCVFS